MKIHRAIIIALFTCLAILTGCQEIPLIKPGGADKPPEIVPLHLNDLPADAQTVIAAFIERMRGVPADRIEGVRFSPAVAAALEQPNFHFTGFQLVALRLFSYDVTRRPGQIALGAFLTFMDPIGRRTAVTIYATYGAVDDTLVVSTGTMELVFPKRPKVELYLVRSAEMPNPIPANHAEFYQAVLARALSPRERARDFGRPQPYTLVAFGMDRLDPKASLQLRVDEKPKGLTGFNGGAQEYNFAGWHAATLSAIFTLTPKQPMYAKVTYTPGTSTPLFFRQTEVVGLFDLRQSKPRAIRVAGMQPPAALHGRALVRAVQQALNRLGYDAGPADGLAGSRTRKAIRAFQRTAGVPVDGRPSNTLLRQLRRYTP